MMIDFKNLTLSDFYTFPVVHNQYGQATLLIDEVEGHPITLIGFQADKNLSDLEIREEGFLYYKQLTEILKNKQQ